MHKLDAPPTTVITEEHVKADRVPMLRGDIESAKFGVEGYDLERFFRAAFGLSEGDSLFLLTPLITQVGTEVYDVFFTARGRMEEALEEVLFAAQCTKFAPIDLDPEDLTGGQPLRVIEPKARDVEPSEQVRYDSIKIKNGIEIIRLHSSGDFTEKSLFEVLASMAGTSEEEVAMMAKGEPVEALIEIDPMKFARLRMALSRLVKRVKDGEDFFSPASQQVRESYIDPEIRPGHFELIAEIQRVNPAITKQDLYSYLAHDIGAKNAGVIQKELYKLTRGVKPENARRVNDIYRALQEVLDKLIEDPYLVNGVRYLSNEEARQMVKTVSEAQEITIGAAAIRLGLYRPSSSRGHTVTKEEYDGLMRMVRTAERKRRRRPSRAPRRVRSMAAEVPTSPPKRLEGHLELIDEIKDLNPAIGKMRLYHYLAEATGLTFAVVSSILGKIAKGLKPKKNDRANKIHQALTAALAGLREDPFIVNGTKYLTHEEAERFIHRVMRSQQVTAKEARQRLGLRLRSKYGYLVTKDELETILEVVREAKANPVPERPSEPSDETVVNNGFDPAWILETNQLPHFGWGRGSNGTHLLNGAGGGMAKNHFSPDYKRIKARFFRSKWYRKY